MNIVDGKIDYLELKDKNANTFYQDEFSSPPLDLANNLIKKKHPVTRVTGYFRISPKIDF